MYDKDHIGEEEFRDAFADVFQKLSMPKALNPKPIIHTCKDGSQVCLNYDRPYGKPIPRMENSHLLNTIRFLERRAKEGVTVRYGGMGVDIDEMWYDEETLYDKEALEYLKYDKYINEAKSRKLM